MRIQKTTIIIALIIFQSIHGSAFAADHLESEIVQLRKTDSVTGSIGSLEGGPGAFFKLSKILLEKGQQQDFEKLSLDKDPIVRAMGLLCLAQKKHEVNRLKECLSDQGIIQYYPYGCMGTTTTVGNFARKVLHNANHLDRKEPPLPLIAPDELIGLDIELLAQDSTTSLHADAAYTVFQVFNEKELELTLPNLRRYAPDLETYEIIKAIGRFGVQNGPKIRDGDDESFRQALLRSLIPGESEDTLPPPKPVRLLPPQRDFLISCVQDKSLDPMSRLAAGSALTRDVNEAVLRVLESQRDDLNMITHGNRGDTFFKTLQNMITHEKLMRIVLAEKMWSTDPNIKNVVINAYSNSHPLALKDLRKSFSAGFHPEYIRTVIRGSILEMSTNIGKFSQPWNTCSDTGYALRLMINIWKEDLRFKHIFRPPEVQELETNVQEAIANHFEGKSERRKSM